MTETPPEHVNCRCAVDTETRLDSEMIAALDEILDRVTACEFPAQPTCEKPVIWVLRATDCHDHVSTTMLCEDHGIFISAQLARAMMLGLIVVLQCKICEHECASPQVEWLRFG